MVEETKSISFLFCPWIDHGAILVVFHRGYTVVLVTEAFFAYFFFFPSFFTGIQVLHTASTIRHSFHQEFAFFIVVSSTTVLSVLILWSTCKISVNF